MLVIIYVLGLIILVMIFGYGFLKIIEHLTNIEKDHIEKDHIERVPGNCPCCNKPYFYVNYHGNNYIEYRCSICGWMCIYKKNKNGRWKKMED